MASGYQERIKENLAHMGTPSSEWRAVPVKGVVETEDAKGKQVSMPVFDFPKDYQKAPTLYPVASAGGEMNCELCGKMPIKTAYWLQNDAQHWILLVGSECVTKFETGKSGKENVRDYQLKQAEMLARDCAKTTKYLLDNFSYMKETRYYNRIEKNRQWNTAFVGQAGYKGNDEILKLRAEGKLDVLLNLYKAGQDSIYWYYVYNAMPFFRDKYEPDEKVKREKELLSWYKRNESKAREMLQAIQFVANAVMDEKLTLETVQQPQIMRFGGKVSGFQYSVGGL